MHLGQGCVTLSPKTGNSCMWKSHTQMEILKGERRIPSLKVFKICSNSWPGAEFGAEGKTVWEMPLQWLLIHAVQHKCKMQCKHVNHSVSLGLHSICLCLLPWPSEVKPKPALNTSRSSHRCSCLRRLGFESCTATNTSWYAFNPNASFKHSNLCCVPQLPIPTQSSKDTQQSTAHLLGFLKLYHSLLSLIYCTWQGVPTNYSHGAFLIRGCKRKQITT